MYHVNLIPSNLGVGFRREFAQVQTNLEIVATRLEKLLVSKAEQCFMADFRYFLKNYNSP